MNCDTCQIKKALADIAKYGKDGICPYGCDVPDIAQRALRGDMDAKRIESAIKLKNLARYLSTASDEMREKHLADERRVFDTMEEQWQDDPKGE